MGAADGQLVAQVILAVLLGAEAIALVGAVVWFAVVAVKDIAEAIADIMAEGWYWYLGAGVLAFLVAVAAGTGLLLGSAIGAGVAFGWILLIVFFD